MISLNWTHSRRYNYIISHEFLTIELEFSETCIFSISRTRSRNATPNTSSTTRFPPPLKSARCCKSRGGGKTNQPFELQSINQGRFRFEKVRRWLGGSSGRNKARRRIDGLENGPGLKEIRKIWKKTKILGLLGRRRKWARRRYWGRRNERGVGNRKSQRRRNRNRTRRRGGGGLN